MVFRNNLTGHFVVLFLVVLAVLAPPPSARAADTGVPLISTELLGGQLEREGGEIVGAYAEFFRQASTQSGVPVDYRIVPWVRAMKETENSDDLLLFPFTRTAERENRYSWIAPLKEDPMCFASVGTPVDNLEDARDLKRVVVWRGTSHQAFLEEQGFENLILVANEKRVIQILNGAHDAAWYWLCDNAQSYLDPDKSDITVKVGASVASETTWLAGGKSFKRTPAIDKFAKAVEALHEEKLLDKLLAEVGK